jgi:hypothetical protein
MPLLLIMTGIASAADATEDNVHSRPLQARRSARQHQQKHRDTDSAYIGLHAQQLTEQFTNIQTGKQTGRQQRHAVNDHGNFLLIVVFQIRAGV